VDGTSAELRAFDAAARLGTMSAAARSLGLTQPTVSAHVAALERRYGVELFFRTGRHVRLTAFGEALREVTHRAFRAEEEALILLQRARSRYCGRLHLCAVGPYNVLPLLHAYRQRWPAVELAVSISDSRQIVQRVLDYRGDVGLPLHAVDDPRLLCRPLRRQRLVVIAPVDHALAGRGSLRRADLDGQSFVMREAGSATRQAFERSLDEAGVRIHVALEIGSRESVREAVAQGFGLGVVARSAHVPDARLAVLPIEDGAPCTHPHVVCLRERAETRLIAGFLDVVEATRPVDDPPPDDG
jgi:aminoethylphosphonate catabolism LysR family transcriptional regulator